MTYSISLVPSASVAYSSQRSPVSVAKLPTPELISYCQQGGQPDRRAFAELIRRYQSHVDQLLYKLAPDWTDRADLAQEVWIRVYRNIHRLQDPAKFRGWMCRIATNLFYDELRRRKRLGKTISFDAPVATGDGEDMSWELPCMSPSPVEQMSTQEFYEQLQMAISDLPEGFRQTIVLREIEDLSYEEIAEITGVSLGTVKSRIARARLKLQVQLQPYLTDI